MTVEKFLYSYNTVIARKLRKEQTKGEKVLWERLRSRKIRGQKFKRQHSIGSFITDFYCYAKRLVVEVDGSIHDEINQNEFDKQREVQINDLGFRVIRFTNKEVFTDIEKVLGEIEKYLG